MARHPDVLIVGGCGFMYGGLFALPHPVGSDNLMTLVQGGQGVPAPVQLPGKEHLPMR
jgi:hypothetical protein